MCSSDLLRCARTLHPRPAAVIYLTDGVGLVNLIRSIRPEEVYNLGAQSHVKVSFDIPEYTFDITAAGTLRLLEAIREAGVTPRFYQASSSEMFGAAPPPQWGNPSIVAERLGDRFDAPFFERGVMKFSALSIPHFRLFMERSVGPMQKLVESLAADPQKLERFRDEFEPGRA